MRWIGKSVTYLVLILCGLTMVVPFLWMVTTALKSQIEVNKGHVGFVPVDDFTYYNDGQTEHRVKVVSAVESSVFVDFFDETGKPVEDDAHRHVMVPASSISQQRDAEVPLGTAVDAVLEGDVDKLENYQEYAPEGYSYYQDGQSSHLVKVVGTVDTEDYVYVHFFDEEGYIIRDEAHTYVKVPANAVQRQRKVTPHWENFAKAWTKVPFGRYFLNTIFVSVAVMVGVIVTGALAAYAFARMKFFGKDFLFYLFISMMMVPQPIYLIPSYVLLNHLGWINTYQALIVPWLANIFTIFLLRQHFKTIPQDLFDAASIDGCSRFRMLWQIVLPLSKSVIATAAIFSIIGSWNSFMWPLVMTNSEGLRVLQVGLSYFSQESSSQTTLLMAASTFSIAPLIALFLLAQRQIISSFASSGLKG